MKELNCLFCASQKLCISHMELEQQRKIDLAGRRKLQISLTPHRILFFTHDCPVQ